MAAPDFSLLRPSDFEGFGRIRLVTPFTDDARRLLDELRSQGRMAQAFPLPERGLVSGLLSGELSFSRIPAMALF
jgi:hypothetical protein